MKSRHQGAVLDRRLREARRQAAGHAHVASPFKVTHPWASASSSAAGRTPTTCVELVRKDSGEVFYRASRPRRGEPAPRRRRSASAPGQGDLHPPRRRAHRPLGARQLRRLPLPRREAEASRRGRRRRRRRPTTYKYAGLPPEKAAAGDDRAGGLRRSRSSPASRTCMQPIAICLDDRGRLWVAEAYTYPIRRRRKARRKDRILIFEDADGDGKFDKRTVFMEGLNLVSGIEVGFGGVWVGAAPYLLFIPDKDGDDKPDGEPQILLDGWGYQDTHETLNTFIWGPDGWLYGCHGVFTHSQRRQAGHAGRGARADQRRRLALPPDEARLRGLRPRHEQPVGPRLQRRRPGVRRGVRHPALLPHHPGRPLPAAGRAALQPVHLRRHQDDRRPPPLRRREPARRQQPLRQRRRRPRPLRPDVLPRRHLAGGVPRPALHGQHPRPAAQRGRARSRRARGYVADHGPDFLLANDALGAVHQPALRPGRQRLPHRLVRQAGLPPQRAGDLGPHQRPHLQDQLPAARSRSTASTCEGDATRSWSKLPAARRTTGTSATPGGCCRSGRATEAARRRRRATALAKIAVEHADETRRLRGAVGAARRPAG